MTEEGLRYYSPSMQGSASLRDFSAVDIVVLTGAQSPCLQLTTPRQPCAVCGLLHSLHAARAPHDLLCRALARAQLRPS